MLLLDELDILNVHRSSSVALNLGSVRSRRRLRKRHSPDTGCRCDYHQNDKPHCGPLSLNQPAATSGISLSVSRQRFDYISLNRDPSRSPSKATRHTWIALCVLQVRWCHLRERLSATDRPTGDNINPVIFVANRYLHRINSNTPIYDV